MPHIVEEHTTEILPISTLMSRLYSVLRPVPMKSRFHASNLLSGRKYIIKNDTVS